MDNGFLEKIYTLMYFNKNNTEIDDEEGITRIKEHAKEVISKLYPKIDEVSEIKYKNPGSIDLDYKSMLNHLVGAAGLSQPEYKTILASKKKGTPVFACVCTLDDGENVYESEYMKGNSKKHAQKAAAMDLYNKLPIWLKSIEDE